MKNIRVLILAFALFFGAVVLNAQTLVVNSSQVNFEDKARPSLVADVDSEKDALASAWATFLKKTYKIKLKGFGLFSNKEVFEAKDVTISEMSANRMNFYTKINSISSGSRISVFASYGYDLFIGPENYPHEYSALNNMLHNFLLKYLDDYYSDRVKTISKNMKSLNDEKAKKTKRIEKNNKKILKLSNEIDMQNSVSNNINEDALKAVEKVSKVSNKKVELENENATYRVRIESIGQEVNVLSDMLNIINRKQSGLYK